MNFNRKLEIAHWNQGKGCKGTRKAKVRAFTESEVKAQIEEQDEEYRTRHVPNRKSATPKKRRKSKLAQIRHRIEWYEQRIAEHEKQAKLNKDHWSCAWASYARDGLRNARKELEEYLENKNVSVRS